MRRMTRRTRHGSRLSYLSYISLLHSKAERGNRGRRRGSENGGGMRGSYHGGRDGGEPMEGLKEGTREIDTGLWRKAVIDACRQAARYFATGAVVLLFLGPT